MAAGEVSLSKSKEAREERRRLRIGLSKCSAATASLPVDSKDDVVVVVVVVDVVVAMIWSKFEAVRKLISVFAKTLGVFLTAAVDDDDDEDEDDDDG